MRSVNSNFRQLVRVFYPTIIKTRVMFAQGKHQQFSSIFLTFENEIIHHLIQGFGDLEVERYFSGSDEGK